MLGPKDFVRRARKNGYYVLDFEATSLDPQTGRVTGLGVKTKDEIAWYPTLGRGATSFVKLMRSFAPLMADPDIEMRGHNLKYDIQWPILSGFPVENRLFDTMVASWMCNENRRSIKMDARSKPSKYGLKKLVWEHFEYRMNTFDETGLLPGIGKDLGEYCMDDCRQTDRLADLYVENLADDELTDVYWRIEAPLIPILADMQMTGLGMNMRTLKRHRHFLREARKALRAQIWDQVGYEFDLGSSQQVAKVLYRDLGLPTDDDECPVPVGKSGQFSTGKETLKNFAAAYPIVRLFLEERHCGVLENTFGKKLAKLAAKSPDGRIRPSWKQHGTKIGRLASSDPNGQNLPRPDYFGETIEEKKHLIRKAMEWFGNWDDDYAGKWNAVRACVEAAAGNMVVSADLSQIELRMMAHWSEDESLVEVYSSGGVCARNCQPYQDYKSGKSKAKCRHIDVHQASADDTGAPRSPTAKNINFGACYRIGPRRLKSYAECPTVDDARRFLQKWYDGKPGVVAFHEWVEDYLPKNSWKIRTITGRLRRLLQESKDNDYKAVTQGIQFVISGSSQDLLKIAMRNQAAKIKQHIKDDAKMKARSPWVDAHFFAQVHDQIDMETPEEIADDCLKDLIDSMETADGGMLAVPVVAEGGTGRTWAEAH